MDTIRIMDAVESVARITPDAVALIGHNGQKLTYEQLITTVGTMSKYLASRGAAPDQRIAFVSASGLETAIAFLAVSNIAAFIPLRPDNSAQQYFYYLDLLKTEKLIVSEEYTGPLVQVAKDMDINVFFMKQSKSKDNIIYEFTGGSEPGLDHSMIMAKGYDIAMVNYTSGTTAKPKIVPRTHINVYYGVKKRIKDYSLTSRDRGLIISPMFRSISLNSIIESLNSGGCAICSDGFELEDFFRLIEETSPTYFSASPVVLQAIAEYAEKNSVKVKNSSLRFVRTTSGRFSETLAERIAAIFNVPIMISYGSTETGCISNTACQPKGYRKGSVGVPDNNNIAIMDENGERQKFNSYGEIVIRGPQVITRYENDEQINGESFFGEWFRTGDAGYMDEDGYLFITGRYKEIINRGVDKVSPYEVEEIILTHPDILQVAVFPVPGPDLSEYVGAAVVLKEGKDLYLKDLRRFLSDQVIAFKIPVFLYVLKEIPVSDAGKVQRNQLYEIIQSLGVEAQTELS